jgi:hypothetical protein
MMEILLLQSKGCAFCDDAEAIVSRLAAEFGVDLVRMDLGSPGGAEIAKRTGVLFPPGILIDRELVCYGRPSEKRLRRELERRSLRADGHSSGTHA